MIDWNWFFSALAQSAAAIIGLGGALLVAKILGNESEFARYLNLSYQLLDEANYLDDRAANRFFSWYNKHSLRKSLDRLWDRLKGLRGDESAILSAEEYYEEEPFSPFIPKADVLNEIERLVDLAKRPPPPKRTSPYDSFANLPPSAMDFRLNEKLSDDLQEERGLIDRLVVDVDHHIRVIRRHLASVQGDPQSSPLVSRVLALNSLLFAVSVLYPLGWLPHRGELEVIVSLSAILAALASFRGLILCLFGAVFAWMMLLLWNTNRKLRYPAELIAALQQRCERGSYSEYLKTLDENNS